MIEVGEYARLNSDYRIIALGIGEVIRINQDTIYVKNNFELPFAFKIENIAKHSKNLIDLIEVGDIVNGERILDITGDYIHTNETDHNRFYLEKHIKTILTKEQMEANQYVVKWDMEAN